MAGTCRVANLPPCGTHRGGGKRTWRVGGAHALKSYDWPSLPGSSTARTARPSPHRVESGGISPRSSAANTLCLPTPSAPARLSVTHRLWASLAASVRPVCFYFWFRPRLHAGCRPCSARLLRVSPPVTCGALRQVQLAPYRHCADKPLAPSLWQASSVQGAEVCPFLILDWYFVAEKRSKA